MRSGKVISTTPEQVAQAIEDIQNGWYKSPSVGNVITKAEWNLAQSEAYMFVSDLKAEGFEPLYVMATRHGEAGAYPTRCRWRSADEIHQAVNGILDY